jgi:tRNA(Ser,Leu) C12 N-acetylase TAN1
VHDWNVIVTVREHQFTTARQLLQTVGLVARTDYFNVLTLKVEDIYHFLDNLHLLRQETLDLEQSIARVMPVQTTFVFQSPQEFEDKARAAVVPWLDQLAEKRFHVRMHRRGFKGRMASQHEEQFLDHFIRQQLLERGVTAEVGFDNPDYIIAVETLGQQAGLALWSREELARYPLVKLD